jgi:hypothetical protein
MLQNVEEGDRYEEEELINNFLSNEGYEIQVHQKRCCYDDGSWFFGYFVGSTSFVYRDLIETYDTFENYYSRDQRELDRILEIGQITKIESKKN